MEISMKQRVIIALVLVGAGPIGPLAQAEEKFLKLNGAQIQARFPDMEMTDEVHWGDVYRRNGALITTEMGHQTVGKWRVQKDQLCLEPAIGGRAQEADRSQLMPGLGQSIGELCHVDQPARTCRMQLRRLCGTPVGRSGPCRGTAK
jgi:hypothetical protein